MVHMTNSQRRKWGQKAVEMIFVGFSDNQKGLQCLNSSNQNVIISENRFSPLGGLINDDAIDAEPSGVISVDIPVGSESIEEVLDESVSYGKRAVIIKSEQYLLDFLKYFYTIKLKCY